MSSSSAFLAARLSVVKLEFQQAWGLLICNWAASLFKILKQAREEQHTELHFSNLFVKQNDWQYTSFVGAEGPITTAWKWGSQYPAAHSTPLAVGRSLPCSGVWKANEEINIMLFLGLSMPWLGIIVLAEFLFLLHPVFPSKGISK